MAIPEDPFMLLSYINMKLRDGDYKNLDDFCQSEGCNKEKLTKKLNEAGFEYIESLNQFR